MAAVGDEDEVKDVMDEYDGPWIEKRIEWAVGHQLDSVELFGSWDRHRGGVMLEWQGQGIYAAEVKLPLGTYVYRFLVNDEDFETDDALPKTIRDGSEFNSITVRENDDESEEEEDEEEEEEEANKESADAEAAEPIGPKLQYDAETGGFVCVGGKKKKKQRRRPSMEIELGAGFIDDAAKTEELDAVEEKQADTADGASPPKKRKKKKKQKMRGFGLRKDNVDLKALFKQKEEEWARMVFVQQLRQQQQHNDEIQRVKTLWKQERQVRVEMHKKVVQQKKELNKKVIASEAEIEKLKQQNKIGAAGDKKMVAQLEDDLKKKDADIEKLKEEVRKAQLDVTDMRRQKVELEKASRGNAADLEGDKKKLLSQISGLEQEIKSLKSQNSNLTSNMETMKSGNQQTLEMETQRFATLQKSWESEKAELLKTIEDGKKVKAELSSTKDELHKMADAKKASDAATEKEKARAAELEGKIKSLDGKIVELSDSTKTNNAIAEAVQKERNTLEAEKRALQEKLDASEKQSAAQKESYEQQLTGLRKQQEADMAALSQKSESEMSSRVEALSKDVSDRDGQIRELKDNVAKLEGGLAEEKSNVENLTKSVEGLNEEVAGLKKDKEGLEAEKATLTAELESVQSQLKSATTDASSAAESATAKITQLEEDLAASKASQAEESKSAEETQQKLQTSIDELKKELDTKAQDSTELTRQLSQAKQDIATLTSSEEQLKEQVQTMTSTLEQEREQSSAKAKELNDQISELEASMETLTSDKNAQINELKDSLGKTENMLQEKLREFNTAETTIAQLRTEVESNNAQYKREKESLEKQLEVAAAKDDNIIKACKGLSTKFQGFRDEMEAIRSEKIQQLEKMNEFFPNFGDLLSKAFGFHQNMVDNLMTKYKRELTLRRKYFNILQDLRGNIRVFCRVRPMLQFELDKGYTSGLTFPEEGSVHVKDDKGTVHKFEFDRVYDVKGTQEQVSEDTTEYVQSVMDGYNVSIFAYGQTGSGKTYTMDGYHDNPGVNLRALRHLFTLAQERAPMFEYTIKVAIFEIYNEKIKDLIHDADAAMGRKKKKKKQAAPAKKEKVEHKVRHLPDGGVEVTNLTWITVTSDADIIKLGDYAKSNRSAGVTDMNAHSSRSHMLQVVDVRGFNLPANIEYLGKLYLVDLAGSERVKKSGATGQAMKEAQNINKSLSALGDVMQALQQKAKFIPYRNSVLTDVMCNSLGGNAKTVMFINCCPTAQHAFETVSSLKFAQRVAKVELGQAKASVGKKKKKAADK